MTLTLADSGLLFATMLTLSALPGPSDLAVVSRSIEGGLRQALLVTAGIASADALLLVMAVQGWALVALLPPTVRPLLQLGGAAVLAWLGLKALLRSRSGDSSGKPARTAAASFLAGFLITIGEPEALLFYFALLPAFVDPAAMTPADATLIVGLAAFAIFIVKTAYALQARRLVGRLRSPRTRLWASCGAGTVLLLLALFLAVESIAQALSSASGVTSEGRP